MGHTRLEDAGEGDPVTADYYATLGVAPTTEDVVIRAAYLALMRRYHPDTNGSPAAAERVRAITAAYQVLSDKDKRADYDRRRATVGGASVARPPLKEFPIGPIVFAGIMLLLIPLVLLAIRSPRSAPEQRIGPAYAQNREQPASIRDPGPLGTSQPRIENPPAIPDPTPGSADDLADPVEVPDQAPVQIRPRLADPPVAPKPPPPLPQPLARADPKPARPMAQASRQPAKPSRDAAANGDNSLAALDRHVTLLHDQSWRFGDATKRAALLRTRDRFLIRRDECGSNACIRDAYLVRMREVSDIMTGQPQPSR